MDFTGIIGPFVLIAIILAIAIVVAAVIISRRKPPVSGNRQPYQNPYQQYPNEPQTNVPQASVPQANAPQPGGPQPGVPQSSVPQPGVPQTTVPQSGGPGFPQKPQRPGWVVPLIVVAVVGVIAAAVLGGVLIGSRFSPDEGRRDEIVSSAAPTQEPEPESSAESRIDTTSSEAPQSTPQESSDYVQSSSPAPSGGGSLSEAIDWIEDSINYVEDYQFEPLGCVDDIDGDGYEDFIASYECQAKNGTWYVAYCVFSLMEDGPQLVTDGVLYQEVGGNSGSVGVAYGKDGSPYLTLFTSAPAGDTMHKFYQFIPWKNLSKWEDNGSFTWEAKWTAGEESAGTYMLGSEKVDKSKFDTSLGNYEERYAINILVGHGNGDVGGVDFDTLEKWYDD